MIGLNNLSEVGVCVCADRAVWGVLVLSSGRAGRGSGEAQRAGRFGVEVRVGWGTAGRAVRFGRGPALCVCAVPPQFLLLASWCSQKPIWRDKLTVNYVAL